MAANRALITGADSGLGADLANVFHNLEYEVVGTAPELVADNVIRFIRWNALEHPHSIVSALKAAGEDKAFDVIINNAGINAIRKFEDLDLEFIQQIMRVNFIAPVLLVQELMAAELVYERAVIVNVISDAAWRPMRHSLAYNCSKAALDMATRQMARELTKPLDVTIIGIRPGFMEGTGMSKYIEQQVCEMRNWTPEQAREYAATNRTANEALDSDAVASLIGSIVINDSVRGMSGACIDLVG